MKTRIAIEKYLDYLEENRYSKYTIISYKINLYKFIKFAPNKVEDISEEIIEKFTNYISTELISYKTKNDRLITLRSFLKFINRDVEMKYHWNDIVLFSDRSDSGLIKIPQQKIIDMFLDTMENVYKKPSYLTRLSEIRSDAVVNLLYSTGLRLSELCSLTRYDIFTEGLDLDSKEAKEIKTVEITIVGKGSKARLVFINRKTLEILRKYLKLRTDDSKALFVTLRRPFFKIKNRQIQDIVEKRVKMLIDSSKIPVGTHITPHTLRHAYATHLISSGASLMAVKDLMGHATITTTQRYLHLSNANLKNEYNKVYG